MQWELTGAAAGGGGGGLKDVAEAVAEEESDGYVLDMRDGSDLDRGSDFEEAAEDRRTVPVSFAFVRDGAGGHLRVEKNICVCGKCPRHGEAEAFVIRAVCLQYRNGGKNRQPSRPCPSIRFRKEYSLAALCRCQPKPRIKEI